jgi:small subunit ribosomal protein S6
MRYYETLYIVNPNLENEVLATTMGEIGTELEKTQSKLINHRIWGKKRLAYQIDNQKYGSFILLQFEGGEQDQMNEFHTWMKLNNAVLRHMTVSLDEQPEVYVEEVKEAPVEEAVKEGTSEEDNEVETEKKAVVESVPEETNPETVEEEPTDEPETTEQVASEESENIEEPTDESSKEETEEKEAE